jgi:hypothetical protein
MSDSEGLRVERNRNVLMSVCVEGARKPTFESRARSPPPLAKIRATLK